MKINDQPLTPFSRNVILVSNQLFYFLFIFFFSALFLNEFQFLVVNKLSVAWPARGLERDFLQGLWGQEKAEGLPADRRLV